MVHTVVVVAVCFVAGALFAFVFFYLLGRRIERRRAAWAHAYTAPAIHRIPRQRNRRAAGVWVDRP